MVDTILALDDYQAMSQRTVNAEGDNNMNFALGLCGEAGEVADMFKKHFFQGHGIARDYLKYELGDILWYVANMARINGLKLSEVATGNIEKLDNRYPNGFEAKRSIDRVEENLEL